MLDAVFSDTGSEDMTPQESLMRRTRRLLSRLDLRARKGLGQHFLIDAGVLKKIVQAAELSPQDTVIEVGPGLGVLTQELVQRAGRVTAVELDANLAEALEETMGGPDNLDIIQADILKLDIDAWLAEAGKKQAFCTGYKMVANLPYYITSAVIRHFLEARSKPSMMVLMVQWEVAKSITAKPGDMSLLALSIQIYGEPKIISRVPAGAFYPAPDVDSAILKINVNPEPAITAEDMAGFFKLARAGFCAPRKQIMNSLAQGLGLDKEDMLQKLVSTDIDPRRRAETLNIDEWHRLWQVFKRSIN
jgi:16S rRNA (adenine1518-N6/adenine1519-N6)-dimethyltransferase